jgi:hypothetical protein
MGSEEENKEKGKGEQRGERSRRVIPLSGFDFIHNKARHCHGVWVTNGIGLERATLLQYHPPTKLWGFLVSGSDLGFSLEFAL